MIEKIYRPVVYFGSAVYLIGLMVMVVDAEEYGSVTLTPDSRLPFETVFVVFLVIALLTMFVKETHQAYLNTRQTKQGRVK